MAYLLNLTKEDIETINFVGDRYNWSGALFYLEEGDNFLTESEAWVIRDKIEDDTEDGHSPFPMLDENSKLYSKLIDFWLSII